MNITAIDAKPNPEFLIKSISEQGYSLETALSDLIDNSISAKANKIEILTEHFLDKTSIFITDNGRGMTKKELGANLQFPSMDMEKERKDGDLGRFGLGLKTASFSQTRKFTVISRKKNTNEYSALTWDVNHLSKTKKWEIIVNTKVDISRFFNRYEIASKNKLEKFSNYEPNTIVIWEGLKNFDNHIINSENRITQLNEELTTNTNEYLRVVFHKFMEDSDLSLNIRLNNILVKPFNPFSSSTSVHARSLEPREMSLGSDVLKIEGFVLPVTASDETSIWTTPNRSLLDMEGVYIYRGNRIIFFGGWNGIIRKQAKLKLARLRIQVGNVNDEKLQLNVAKSKISIPYELKVGVLRYISELKTEAIKEYNNRGLRNTTNRNLNSKNDFNLLKKITSSKGPIYSINKEYPLVKMVSEELNKDALKYFRVLLKSINVLLNKQRYTDDSYVKIIQDDISIDDIITTTKKLLESGLSKDCIYDVFLKGAGFEKNKLPEKLKKIL
ncbi:ATP-binding protein [Tenacibaculum finnmarkense]|uniref:ATP-binding protein n=1 Tax=Tenacibaculum finnmarkense TaxID=2781243 RepID=UPI001E47D862|nr:ATP-binding protein [Tenacibaculum finnmarkense]MCD8409896.1 ATP-binding protein [Tenacibaculum finnmarkense genomovar ulcerans]MCD8445846.1 ATP-binding protein [Tenacibaculum finnmarkense genomovar finnmarkense]